MATFKCKMCDAILNVQEGTNIYVCEYCGTRQEISRGTYDKENGSVSMKSLLKRAFMFLEDGDWEQAILYAEKVLDIDPENAKAYLCKLMADINVHSESELSDPCLDYRNNDNYIKVLRFGDPQMVNNLKAYAIESAYKMALKLMNSAVQEKDYYQAANQFRAVAGYKYANERAVECEKLAKQKAEEEKKQRREEKMKHDYIYIISFYLFSQMFFGILVAASFNKPAKKIIIQSFIAAIAAVLGVFICRYFYRVMNADKFKFWAAVIFNNIITSLYIYTGTSEISNKRYTDILIAIAVCSLISGFIGDRLGKRKTEKKSHKDD